MKQINYELDFIKLFFNSIRFLNIFLLVLLCNSKYFYGQAKIYRRFKGY